MIHYSIGQAIQLVRFSIEVFMTTSITRSFRYLRPVYFIDGRDQQNRPTKDLYQGGIENTDRSLALLQPLREVAKVPTFRVLRHDRSEVVDCHNLASARAIAEGRAPCKVDEPTTYTYKCKAFVAPSGQYYVEIAAGSITVRMDVANAQTARHYVKNGVCTDLAYEAYMSNLSQ